jgi:endoglucanase
VGLDLTGGYHDAGDHVKFNQPMTFTLATLAWSVVEYRDAYASVGQLDEALAAIKWGTDYLLKSHRTSNGKTSELYVQVGNGDLDHNYWGPPEQMTMARPSYKVTPSKPGSDIAMNTAAALAAASMAFKPYDSAYADKLLTNARQLHTFAETHRGKYSDSVPQASPFYTSWSGYQDELAWGSAWLYKATGERGYLDKAKSYYDADAAIGDWTYSGDDASYGTVVLLSQAEPNSKYVGYARNWLNTWINGTGGVKYSSGGYAWRAQWASAALNAGTSFMALVFNDTVSADSRYVNFATRQVNYLLGDNPRGFSYMVGFGNNYPKRPHHRACHGVSGYSNYGSTAENKYICWGSLVGGPQSANDYDHQDDRTNVYGNEGGTSYNAPFAGALIGLYSRLGGPALR